MSKSKAKRGTNASSSGGERKGKKGKAKAKGKKQGNDGESAPAPDSWDKNDGGATPNPFAYRNTCNVYEVVKTFFGAVILLPIRLVLVLVLLILIYPFLLVATVGMDETQPMPRWRKGFRYPLFPCARMLLFVMGYYWIPVRGHRASHGEAPVLVAAPHSGFVDPLILAVICKRPCIVAKAGIRGVPIVGRAARAMETIFVDRTQHDSKKRTLEAIVNRAHSDGEWPQVLIFPEGTVTNREALITFKAGPFVPGVPVQPIAMRYPWYCFNPVWGISSPSAGIQVLRVLTQWLNLCTVTFLPPYTPSEEEVADANLYARNVRAVVAEHLGVPVTEHSFEDVRLQAQAVKSHLPPDAGVIEYGVVRTEVGLGLDDIQAAFERFAEFDTDKNGQLNLQEMSRFLGLPEEHVEPMFNRLDVDDSGLLDFREWIMGLAFAQGEATNTEVIEFAFNFFDSDGNGSLSLEELSACLSSAFPGVSKADLGRIFEEADVDKNGEISLEEFQAYARTNPLLQEAFIGLDGPRTFTMSQSNTGSNEGGGASGYSGASVSLTSAASSNSNSNSNSNSSSASSS